MSLNGKNGMPESIISMDDSEAGSLEQIRAFLAGSGEARSAGQRREELYGWVEQMLVRQPYASLDKPGKGVPAAGLRGIPKTVKHPETAAPAPADSPVCVRLFA